jgi:hypothetical protein
VTGGCGPSLISRTGLLARVGSLLPVGLFSRKRTITLATQLRRAVPECGRLEIPHSYGQGNNGASILIRRPWFMEPKLGALNSVSSLPPQPLRISDAACSTGLVEKVTYGKTSGIWES